MHPRRTGSSGYAAARDDSRKADSIRGEKTHSDTRRRKKTRGKRSVFETRRLTRIRGSAIRLAVLLYPRPEDSSGYAAVAPRRLAAKPLIFVARRLAGIYRRDEKARLPVLTREVSKRMRGGDPLCCCGGDRVIAAAQVRTFILVTSEDTGRGTPWRRCYHSVFLLFGLCGA